MVPPESCCVQITSFAAHEESVTVKVTIAPAASNAAFMVIVPHTALMITVVDLSVFWLTVLPAPVEYPMPAEALELNTAPVAFTVESEAVPVAESVVNAPAAGVVPPIEMLLIVFLNVGAEPVLPCRIVLSAPADVADTGDVPFPNRTPCKVSVVTPVPPLATFSVELMVNVRN
jgi:hypothetical protein